MKKVRKKYAIEYYLLRLSRIEESIAMNYLPKKLGVSLRTLQLWKSIPEDSKKSMPADALMLLADFFEVEPKDMYTNELPTIRREFLNEVTKSESLEDIL